MQLWSGWNADVATLGARHNANRHPSFEHLVVHTEDLIDPDTKFEAVWVAAIRGIGLRRNNANSVAGFVNQSSKNRPAPKGKLPKLFFVMQGRSFGKAQQGHLVNEHGTRARGSGAANRGLRGRAGSDERRLVLPSGAAGRVHGQSRQGRPRCVAGVGHGGGGFVRRGACLFFTSPPSPSFVL